MSNSHDPLNEELADACVILGLAPPFGADEAKSRYRELAKLYHPDVGVLKNGPRFAEISRAYDLIEKNLERLSTVKLSVWMGADASHSRIEELLRQLHEARTKSVKAETRAQQEAEKANAVRQNYLLSHKSSSKVLIGTILICIAALTLGFLAGMIWSSTPPIVPVKSNQTYEIVGDLTTTTQQFLADQYSHLSADLTWKGPLKYRLEYTSGTVTVGDGVATLNSTPTIVLETLPLLKISVAQRAETTGTATATSAAPITPPLITEP